MVPSTTHLTLSWRRPKVDTIGILFPVGTLRKGASLVAGVGARGASSGGRGAAKNTGISGLVASLASKTAAGCA